MKLSKKDLISYLKTECGLTQSQAEATVNAMIDFVQNHVAAGDSVTLTGFGTFSKVETAAREGINPATKQRITIPAGSKPHFKAGKAFKDIVAGN